MDQKETMNYSTISKVLSANDTGENGTHQAGILIPKQESILSFFPKMTSEEKNPRAKLEFIDNSNDKWEFMFIYYNNKFFGGTRNEFRLTGMTAFIRENNLKAGDEIFLVKKSNFERFIFIKRSEENKSSNVLKLGNTWKVVKI